MTGTEGRWKGGMEMKILATFVGTNREFQAWLRAGMPRNVVFMEEYRMKKAAREAAMRKSFGPSIA
jgi:hypothetical protein